MSHHTPDMIRVTDPAERIGHWILAVSCLFCLFTGLGLMFHAWSIIPTVLGGYFATKWLHISSGIVFALSMAYAYNMWWKDCVFEKQDLDWMKVAGGYLWATSKVPPPYKYNAGQKAFFWCIIGAGILIILSGLVMWFPLNLPVWIARWSYVLHALSAVIIGAFFMIHLYLGTVGNPGTVQAMFTGYCTRAWCQTHCPRWLKDYDKNVLKNK